MSNYVTAIGLDVHARSIKACALNPMTGRSSAPPSATTPRRSPSGPSGSSRRRRSTSWRDRLTLCRALFPPSALGCAVPSPRCSARGRPRQEDRPARRRVPRKASRHAQRHVEVWVPDGRTGAAVRLPRAGGRRDDLRRANGGCPEFLLRHGHVFDEAAPTGRRKETGRGRTGGGPTRSSSHQATTPPTTTATRAALRGARDAGERVAESALAPSGSGRGRASGCVKGVDVATAFLLVPRWATPPGFPSAPSFASWCRLMLGHSRQRDLVEGGITRAGNATSTRRSSGGGLARAMSRRETRSRSRRAEVARPRCSATRRSATAGSSTVRGGDGRPGKRPVVANCATAREMAACWVWAIAGMAAAWPSRTAQGPLVPRRVRGRWEASSPFLWAAGNRHARLKDFGRGPSRSNECAADRPRAGC